MPTIDTTVSADAELEARHAEAESRVTTYSYVRQQGESAKSRVSLARTDLVNAVVQIVKKDGGENNLHYHTAIDTFWMVLKGRVRFYGPGDELIGKAGLFRSGEAKAGREAQSSAFFSTPDMP